MRIMKSFYLGLCSIFLLLSLLILGTDQTVKAEDPTQTPEPPTATATYHSLMDLEGTPLPTGYACSNYVLGIGTLTPSAHWMLYCSNCLRDVEYSLTQTAKPTQTDRTATPTATYYPGETRTPTPTPEPSYYLGDIIEFFVTGTSDLYTYFDITVPEGAIPKYVFAVRGENIGGFHYDVNVDDQLVARISQGYWQNVNKTWDSTPANFSELQAEFQNSVPYADLVYDWWTTESDRTWITLDEDSFEINIKQYMNDPMDSVKVYVAVVYYGVDQGQPTPTPQPTATHIPGGYCSEIEEEGEEEELFNMPNFLVGEANCTTFEGRTIDFSAVNWLPGINIPTVEVPGFEICIMGIYFGILDILGFEINLDTLAGIVGSIAILRWFMRS